MVALAPFRGVRFDPARVADLAAVTAPPYDTIDEATQGRLHEASPYNVVRLELPLGDRSDDSAHSRYMAAARTYARWRADGVLARDAQPSLYVYEQTFQNPEPRRQIGLVGALGLVPFDAGEVLPHEHVYPDPVTDRLRLLRAVPVNLSPVFGMYAERDPDVDAVLADARSRPPAAAFADADGIGHRLWPVSDPAELRRVTAALAPRRLLLADGHHRYTAALRHRLEVGALPGTADGEPGAGAVLAHLVAQQDGPILRAMHRQVRRLPADWRHRLTAHGAHLRPVAAPGDPSGVPAALAALDDGPADGFVVLTRAGVWAVHPGRLAEVVPDDTPRVLHELTVTLLQAVLTRVLDVPERIEDLYYTPAADQAAAAVASGSHDAVFLVRPVPIDAVWRAAEDGIRMPPKSTSFHPKPRTGLVLRPLDGGPDAGQ